MSESAAGALARCSAWLLDAVGCLIEPCEPPARVYVRIAARHGIRAHEARVAQRLARALQSLRPPIGSDLGAVREHEREGWRAVVHAALGEAAASGPCFDALFAHYAGAEAWTVLPGATEALDAARARSIRLGVVSNMDARLLSVLEALGLSVRFQVLALPSTCGYAKPDPAVFRWALTRLEHAAEQTLYVGDRGPGCVEAARALGLHGLLLGASARVRAPLSARGPSPSARSWHEIHTLLT